MRKKLALLTLSGFICFNCLASNYYWNPNLMVSNNWSDLNNWFTTSGGSVNHTALPGPTDDVYFDVNTIEPVMTVDINAQCHSVIFTGPFSYAPGIYFSASNVLEIYGSFYPDDNLELLFAILLFKSTSPGNQIDLNAPSSAMWGLTVEFNGTGGEWTLIDDAHVETGSLSIYEGKLFTNNYNVYTNSFGLYGNILREVYLGQSHIYTYDGGFLAYGSNYFVDADSAFIYLMEGPAMGLAGDNIHYHYVQTDTLAGVITIEGSNCEIDSMVNYGWPNTINMTGTIHNAQFFGGGNLSTAPAPYLFYDTLILDNTVGWSWDGQYNYGCDSFFVNNVFQVNSGLADTITITEYIPSGFTNIIYLPNDTICLDYVKLKGSNARGSGNYYAGANSIDLGSNSNWAFIGCGMPIITGLSIEAIDELTVYPNPTNSIVTLSRIEKESVIEVINVLGEKIISVQSNNISIDLDLSELENGIYFVKVSSEKGMVTKRVVKQ